MELEIASPRADVQPGFNRQGWQAQLSLFIARRGETSEIRRRVHSGPLQIQRAFYPEGPGRCHVYLLHPPGGVVASDALTIDVTVGAAAEALLTTPAAGKFYRSSRPQDCAHVSQRLSVGAGAHLEWMPQETIVFNGACARTQTRVDLAASARFIGWEITCLGRPASSERYTRGCFRQSFEVWRAGRPLFIERSALNAEGPVLGARWGLADAPVLGTFVAALDAPQGEDTSIDSGLNRAGLGAGISAGTIAGTIAGILDRLRAMVGEQPDGDAAAVTALDGVLVARYLGGSTARARALFERFWREIRRELWRRPPVDPRIWKT